MNTHGLLNLVLNLIFISFYLSLFFWTTVFVRPSATNSKYLCFESEIHGICSLHQKRTLFVQLSTKCIEITSHPSRSIQHSFTSKLYFYG